MLEWFKNTELYTGIVVSLSLTVIALGKKIGGIYVERLEKQEKKTAAMDDKLDNMESEMKVISNNLELLIQGHIKVHGAEVFERNKAIVETN